MTSTPTADVNTIWTAEMFISSYQVDQFGTMSIPAMCSLFEELAWKHADANKFGYEHLKEKNLFWVLSRLAVKIHKRPVWKQNIISKTWTCGVEGLFARREFQVEDESGEVLITAVSHWLMLDLATRLMVRTGNYKELFSMQREKALDYIPVKIKPVKPDIVSGFSEVLFSDIDLNRHMNNVRYLQRIIDSYDYGVIEKYKITAFDINFLNEALIGDQLAVVCQEADEQEQYAAVVRQSDNLDMARMRLNWSVR